MRAEALARREGHVDAVAFSRTGDPATGDFRDGTVLRKFGDVPDDLSALRYRERLLLRAVTLTGWVKTRITLRLQIAALSSIVAQC
jgi:hypothetical protein